MPERSAWPTCRSTAPGTSRRRGGRQRTSTVRGNRGKARRARPHRRPARALAPIAACAARRAPVARDLVRVPAHRGRASRSREGSRLHGRCCWQLHRWSALGAMGMITNGRENQWAREPRSVQAKPVGETNSRAQGCREIYIRFSILTHKIVPVRTCINYMCTDSFFSSIIYRV